MKLDNIENL